MKGQVRKLQKGFTLIELMIVVAIIGVLSAIAIPAYKNYVTKSEAASGLATVKALVTPAELFHQEKGSAAVPTFADLGTAADVNALGTVGVAASEIKFTFNGNSSISGAKFTFSRDEASGWDCAATGAIPALDGCQ